jgi:hypothetical protein
MNFKRGGAASGPFFFVATREKAFAPRASKGRRPGDEVSLQSNREADLAKPARLMQICSIQSRMPGLVVKLADKLV